VSREGIDFQVSEMYAARGWGLEKNLKFFARELRSGGLARSKKRITSSLSSFIK
jgi:hypothetical protein